MTADTTTISTESQRELARDRSWENTAMVEDTDGRFYTVAELRTAFDKLFNSYCATIPLMKLPAPVPAPALPAIEPARDWRHTVVNIEIPATELAIVSAAVRYFTATKVRVIANRWEGSLYGGRSMLTIGAAGYRKGPAGDH